MFTEFSYLFCRKRILWNLKQILHYNWALTIATSKGKDQNYTLSCNGSRAGLSLIFDSCLVCMFWFLRMNNIRDNPQASKDESFFETGREIHKDIIAQKLSQILVAQIDCQIARTAFLPSNANFHCSVVIAALFILCIWYSSKAQLWFHETPSTHDGARKKGHMQEPVRSYYKNHGKTRRGRGGTSTEV